MEAEKSNTREWEIDNLPNRITIFRIVLIPITLVGLFLIQTGWETFEKHHSLLGWISACAFGVAGITDFFDGYIARKRNIVTVLGSFLDPIADKFLVVSSLIMLQGLGRIPVLVVIILVLREMYITALRLLATERGFSIPVGQLGKWKTTVQMLAIPFLMIYDFDLAFPFVGTILIYIACFLSIYSALEYSVGMIKKIRIEMKKHRETKE